MTPKAASPSRQSPNPLAGGAGHTVRRSAHRASPHPLAGKAGHKVRRSAHRA